MCLVRSAIFAIITLHFYFLLLYVCFYRVYLFYVLELYIFINTYNQISEFLKYCVKSSFPKTIVFYRDRSLLHFGKGVIPLRIVNSKKMSDLFPLLNLRQWQTLVNFMSTFIIFM